MEVQDVGDPQLENHARLSGLLAMLALPFVRSDLGMMRRRIVEVETGPGKWTPIEGATISLNNLTLWTGSNGSRIQWEFKATQCPRWRTPSASLNPRTYIEGQT